MNKPIFLAAFCSLVISYAKTQINDTEHNDINGYRQKLQNIDHLVQQQNWNDASKKWREIISLNPVDGEIWYRYGDCLYRNDEPVKAIDAFQNAMRIGSLPYSPADCAYY